MSRRLLRFELTNTRCIESISMQPAEELSFVMGDNGSGKSSLLDGLALLADMVRGGLNEAAIALRRGLPVGPSIDLGTLFRRPDQPMRWTLEFSIDDQRWVYELAVRRTLTDTGMAIHHERLARLDVGDGEVLLTDETGCRLRDGSDGRTDWMPVTPSSSHPALGRAQDPLVFPQLHRVWSFVCGIQLVRLNPVEMRGPAGRVSIDQLPDRLGRDFQSRVRALLLKRPDRREPWLDDLAARTGWKEVRASDGDGDELMMVREDANAGWSPLVYASDGQIVSAWLALLVQAPPASLSVLLFDEPALAVSTKGMEDVAEFLRLLAEDFQVIAATHSRETVDAHKHGDDTWVMERGWGAPARVTPLKEHPKGKKLARVVPPGSAAERAWGDND